MTQQPQEPIVIPYEEDDRLIHTSEHLFCNDMDCPCHEESEFIEQVQTWVTEGLITAEDAGRLYRGESAN